MIPDNSSDAGSLALAIETSGDVGSVALGRGRRIIGAATLETPRNHAVELLPTIRSLCIKHAAGPGDLRSVFVSIGPGSFTGLRLGVTVARMIALTGDARLVPVPTLDVIAQNALDLDDPPDGVVVVLDAQRGRVYAVAFVRNGDRYDAVTEPAEVDPVSFLTRHRSPKRAFVVLGFGARKHRDAITAAGFELAPETLHTPRAETVYRLGAVRLEAGKVVDRGDLVPAYVRPPEAEEKWARRQASR